MHWVYVGIQKDVTSQEENLEKLKFLAVHDDLTGLLNRRGLYMAVDNFYAWANRTQQKFRSNDLLSRVGGDEFIILTYLNIRHKLRCVYRAFPLDFLPFEYGLRIIASSLNIKII